MTPKQYKLYKAIDDFIKLNGYAPSIRELCKIVGNNSPATIFTKLKQLEKKGYISYVKGKSRTIKILK